MIKVTKEDYARFLSTSPKWNGAKDVDFLCATYTRNKLKYLYELIAED